MSSRRKTVVITGASDGLGAAAARQLHADGHTVVIIGRSPDKTTAVAAELGCDHHIADFTRLDEVARLARELKATYRQIDVLANNAGGVFGARTKTVDGFEKTFQVNHLAPFLLTHLLMDTLIASHASVLQTSSTVRFTKEVRLDDLDHDRDFDPTVAYAAAKLENILFTTELHRRYHSSGISTASFYPGNVASNFGSGTTSRSIRLVRALTANALARRLLLSTPEQGADQIVWLAENEPGQEWQSGAYYYKRRACRPRNAQAVDPEFARKLWERSEELLGAQMRA